MYSLRILKTLCRKLKLPEDFDYKQLARLTPGYVGADLMALCREAAMCAVNRVLLEMHGQSKGQNQARMVELSPDKAPLQQGLGPQGAAGLESGVLGPIQDGNSSFSMENQEMTDLSQMPQGDTELQHPATQEPFEVRKMIYVRLELFHYVGVFCDSVVLFWFVNTLIIGLKLG